MDKDHRAAFASQSPLLSREHRAAFNDQWRAIAASFERSPRAAVEDADHLVAQTIARLAETFTQERAHLEARWGHGVEPTHEDLRQTLEAYRRFLLRLLAI
jgi:hypothetical protein